MSVKHFGVSGLEQILLLRIAMLRSNLCPHLKSLGVILDLRRVIVLNPVFRQTYHTIEVRKVLASPPHTWKESWNLVFFLVLPSS